MIPPPLRWALPASLILLACVSAFAGPREKLDSHIVQALQKARGEAPFDKPTTVDPGLATEADGRVLVDLTATVSKELLAEIERRGGKVINSFEKARAVRALLPLAQMEALAGRTDVQFIAPAAEAATNQPTISP